MGMNYYLYRNRCDKCNRSDELHIGKSSFGWTFALHIIPEEGINELEDWIKLFKNKNNIIKDEENRVITKNKIVEIISKRNIEKRNEIDNKWCIGYGKDGTYDLVLGNFS